VEKAAEWLRPLGDIRLLPTTGPNTAGAIARQAAERGATRVVVFGGDGTVNEAANGLIGTATPMLTLPGGTANVLCVETGIGTHPEKAAKRLVEESEDVRIAVGRMTAPGAAPRHFLIMAGVGLDAMVVDEVNASLKSKIGKVAYWIAGFGMFGRSLPQFDAAINGATVRRSFVLVSRVKNYGGDLEIAKNVSLLDNCFEAVSFHGRNSLRYLPYLAAVLVGQVAKMPGAAAEAATRIACAPVDGSRVPIQLDGELAGTLPATFEIVPDALTLRIPSAYVRRAKASQWTTSPTR
jgi:diacylglycerol kinase (ATP)